MKCYIKKQTNKLDLKSATYLEVDDARDVLEYGDREVTPAEYGYKKGLI